MTAEMSLFAPPPPDHRAPAQRPTARIDRPPAPPGPIEKSRDRHAPGECITKPDTVVPSPDSVVDTEDGKLLLTEREAAKALSVCQRTLWQLRSDGHIPCVRIGRAVRYRPADLRAWIAAHQH